MAGGFQAIVLIIIIIHFFKVAWRDFDDVGSEKGWMGEQGLGVIGSFKGDSLKKNSRGR